MQAPTAHECEYPRVKYDYGKPMGEAMLDDILRAPKYKSPIEIIQKGFTTKIEDDVCKAVWEYGISVDKEELIKALRYDREQYEKGYADGCIGSTAAIKAEVAREIFEEIEKHCEVALMNGHIETPILCIGFDVLAELKKKYTEEKSNV